MHFRQLRGWLVRLCGLFHRKQREREFAEELESHLAFHIEDNLRAGMSPEEARRWALIKLGGVTLTQERYREQGGLPMLETLIQDLRFGLRMLQKNPGFSLIAILTLALGIGANTAIFSVVNAVLLRPLPYRDAEQLVMVWHRNVNQGGLQAGNFELSPANFLDLQKQNQSFAQIAAFVNHDFNLTSGGEPERVMGWQTSSTLFDVLGIAPVMGRGFTANDDRDGAEPVVVISHGFWQRRFGGQANALGQTLRLDERNVTVIGVLPPGFEFPVKGSDLWMTLSMNAGQANARAAFVLSAVARLKSGVTMAQASSEMETISLSLESAFPRSNAGVRFAVEPLRERQGGNARTTLYLLLGAVGCVLLIACVNVANLLLARAAVRERELALRAALGAGRQRLLRQMLTESALLSLLGGGGGLLLAWWGVRALRVLDPGGLVRLDQVSLDGRVLSFTLGVSLLTGVLFGLAPALQSSRLNLNQALKEGGRGTAGKADNRLRGAFVIAEVALSLVLLVGAGLLIRSFVHLLNVDTGFRPERLLTLRVELSQAKVQDPAQAAGFYQQVLERIQALPGVEAASVVNALPIATPGMRSSLTFEDQPDSPPGQPQLGNNRVVSPDYFRSLGIPLLGGRTLTVQDNASAPPVAVINQSLARRYWGAENPLGKRFKLGVRNAASPWLTVVGVVGDVRQEGLSNAPLPEFYTPFTQAHARMARLRVLAVRTTGDPLALAGAIKSAIWAIDRDQTIYEVQTMDAIVAKWLAPRRFNLVLLGVFAAFALVLAGVGIYGVISYTVTQRTKEIGVRMALGASRLDIVRLVVRQGMLLTAAGIALGLAASLALTRFIAGFLFEVRAYDPLTLIGVTLLLTAVACFACWLPARRAAKVDPLIALRHD
jgi:putative ABC transport system permease protein